MIPTDDIENRFAYHAPKGGKVEAHESIRKECEQLAHAINVMCPDCREKSISITKIEEAMFWANAAIARH